MPEMGKYNQRVTVWKNEPTTNDDGQRVENEVKFIERWAYVRPGGVRRSSGGEVYRAQQQQSDLTHHVQILSDRQTRTIDTGMWLTLRDGTRLDITRIYDFDLRRIELILECNHRE